MEVVALPVAALLLAHQALVLGVAQLVIAGQASAPHAGVDADHGALAGDLTELVHPDSAANAHVELLEDRLNKTILKHRHKNNNTTSLHQEQ